MQIIELDGWAFCARASTTGQVGIRDFRQQKAVIALVRDMKNAGVYEKMKAVYPFVGGTATTHMFNLKDPRDRDLSFRLQFNGGWTHSANGADPNGTNAYANSFFVANNESMVLFNGHLSYYARENITVTGSTQSLLGVASNGSGWNNREAWFIEFASSNANYSQHSTASTTDRAYVSPTISMQGFNLGTRRTSDATTLKFWQNGSLKNTASTSVTGQALNIYPVFIGAFRNQTALSPFASNYTSNQCAFASIGLGLTDTEAINFNSVVQRYQSALGRKV
jgi:hypothetical protein